ncbi:MAG: flagellar export chaperone FliS [Lachnospiraceae bacterium]|nr:flagellar export chaperone FliS [Lachnospiraceae bacterium]
MDRERLKEFTFRVSQASRTELIVIMYDVILSDTKVARQALVEGDVAGYRSELKHAQRFLSELMGALDYQYDISYELLSLYSFANKSLIRASVSRDPALLDAVDKVVTGLRASFREIAAQDTDGPIMRNTEQVYAGLTYGKGCLNESSLDPNGTKRGFMA